MLRHCILTWKDSNRMLAATSAIFTVLFRHGIRGIQAVVHSPRHDRTTLEQPIPYLKELSISASSQCNEHMKKPIAWGTKTIPFESGHTILEALVATSITAIVSVGLWQLVASTRTLAHSQFIDSAPTCEVPQCHETLRGFTCRCGPYTFLSIR